MRLLVACPQCKRQFDVIGKPIGSQFRCHCGTIVAVQQPSGHDAMVVRCASCGAPRQEGSMSCTYCGADFTLHEQDLDTVCPQCLARISDQAKFCHHCGTALMPESLGSQESAVSCPACGPTFQLHHRAVGNVALLECKRCAGFWIAASVFEYLVEHASHEALGIDCRQQSQSPNIIDITAEKRGPQYRKCPVCGTIMNRTNYGHRSGLIIDACKKHGVWFDADELPRILKWIRSGGQAKAEHVAIEEAKREAIHKDRIKWLTRNDRWKDPIE